MKRDAFWQGSEHGNASNQLLRTLSYIFLNLWPRAQVSIFRKCVFFWPPPARSVQLQKYNECIKRYAGNEKWVFWLSCGHGSRGRIVFVISIKYGKKSILTKKTMSMMMRTYLMKFMLQHPESRVFGFLILICFCFCGDGFLLFAVVPFLPLSWLLLLLLTLLLLLLFWWLLLLAVPFLADLFGAIALHFLLSFYSSPEIFISHSHFTTKREFSFFISHSSRLHFKYRRHRHHRRRSLVVIDFCQQFFILFFACDWYLVVSLDFCSVLFNSFSLASNNRGKFTSTVAQKGHFWVRESENNSEALKQTFFESYWRFFVTQ